MSELCPLCDEPVRPGEQAADPLHTPEGPRRVHRACMLREVIGGIGHLIAHDYWCRFKGDPDAGLTRWQSARLVDVYISVVGIETAVRQGQSDAG
jgi:hypothetical protein